MASLSNCCRLCSKIRVKNVVNFSDVEKGQSESYKEIIEQLFGIEVREQGDHIFKLPYYSDEIFLFVI